MADFYFLNTGEDYNGTGGANWINGANWSDTDMGAPLGIIPTNTDDAFFTANSGNCTVANGTPACRNLTCTGYTRRLYVYDKVLAIAGNAILSSQMKLDMYNISPVTGAHLSFSSAAPMSILTNGIRVPCLYVNNKLTLLDNLNCDIIHVPVSTNAQFDGSFGWTTRRLEPSAAVRGLTVTLQAGNTYKVTDMFINNYDSGGSHGKVVSSDSTTHVKAILTVTGEINIGYVDFTDINALGGRPLYTFNGVVTNSDNIFTMTDAPIPADTTQESSMII